MEKIFVNTIYSPVGNLLLGSTDTKLKFVHFSDSAEKQTDQIPDILMETEKQLQEYFKGIRYTFDLPMDPDGTEFQKKVWLLVQKVPFGKTSTYHEIAKKLGNKKYIRAVGMANGKNPIPIIVPCHRIIGSDGKLVGYAGGIERKKQLLLHEIKYQKKGILF